MTAGPLFWPHLAITTLALLQLLMACTSWLVLRGPRHAQALQLWAAGTLALGLSLAPGGLADSAPPALPDALRMLLPALLPAGLLLRVLALRRHMGRPLHLGAGLAIVALAALGWAFCLQADEPRVRISYANAVLVLGTAVVGWHAWEDSRRGGAPTARWLAWTEWLLAGCLLLRALAIAAGSPPSGGWDWWLAMAAAALAALFGNLGYLGMLLDDLHRAALQARQAQLDETSSRAAAEQTTLALQALLAQRDALADEHERLLQLLAHEIRQPLHNAGLAIQGAAQVLQQPRGDDAARVDAQLLQAQAVLGDVRAVLDNTLAAATLLQREAPLRRQVVALDFLVELTLADLSARQRDRLTVDWRTDLDQLLVEPGLVRLALRNLLHNAFNHAGPAAQVVLRIDLMPATHSLRLAVADDGPGITPGQLQRPEPGSGLPGRRRLGLQIVRQVMDLHGGQLVLGNELPRGFVAQLVFPLPAAQAGSSGARNT